MDTRTLAEALTDAILAAMPAAPAATEGVRGPVLEVQVGAAWVEASGPEWRSWTGRRMVNGEEVHGPVYVFGSPDGSLPFTGRRVCGCRECQEHVAPEFRPN